MANGFKFPNTGIRKSFVERNYAHLGIGHLPYSADNKTYTSNTTGTSSTRRPSYYKRSVTYRNTPMNLRTGEGMRERGSIGVMNEAHASSFAKGLRKYGKGFKKAVKGQVKSEKIIDKGAKRLGKIDKRLGGKRDKKMMNYYSALFSSAFSPGSVKPGRLNRLKKQYERSVTKYDKKMENVSQRVGGRAVKVKTKAFLKAGKGFSGFKGEAGTRPFDAKGRPTHTNPVYASYKEFDKSSKKVGDLKTIGGQGSGVPSQYMSNLTSARNLSLDKVKTFANAYNAYNLRKVKKAKNSPAYKYSVKQGRNPGNFNM